jgi:hypothetical protein
LSILRKVAVAEKANTPITVEKVHYASAYEKSGILHVKKAECHMIRTAIPKASANPALRYDPARL